MRQTRWERAHVADQSYALIRALFGRVVHTVGLHRRVVEIEPSGIKRAIHSVSADICRKLSWIAVVIKITPRKRNAALKLPDTLHLPAAKNSINDAVPVIAQ